MNEYTALLMHGKKIFSFSVFFNIQKLVFHKGKKIQVLFK